MWPFGDDSKQFSTSPHATDLAVRVVMLIGIFASENHVACFFTEWISNPDNSLSTLCAESLLYDEENDLCIHF